MSAAIPAAAMISVRAGVDDGLKVRIADALLGIHERQTPVDYE